MPKSYPLPTSFAPRDFAPSWKTEDIVRYLDPNRRRVSAKEIAKTRLAQNRHVKPVAGPRALSWGGEFCPRAASPAPGTMSLFQGDAPCRRENVPVSGRRALP